MDRDEATSLKAQQVFEKLADWKDTFPDEGWRAVDDVLKSGTRVEVVKKAVGALEITVEAPDQFMVRVPRGVPRTLAEKEMWEAVRRWVLLLDRNA